jgi:hypothetical protein
MKARDFSRAFVVLIDICSYSHSIVLGGLDEMS